MTTQTNSDEQFSQWFEDAFPERMYKDKQERELLMVSTWLAWRDSRRIEKENSDD